MVKGSKGAIFMRYDVDDVYDSLHLEGRLGPTGTVPCFYIYLILYMRRGGDFDFRFQVHRVWVLGASHNR
jgi:hypothetical protein